MRFFFVRAGGVRPLTAVLLRRWRPKRDPFPGIDFKGFFGVGPPFHLDQELKMEVKL
jgi:hypothetical protein